MTLPRAAAVDLQKSAAENRLIVGVGNDQEVVFRGLCFHSLLLTLVAEGIKLDIRPREASAQSKQRLGRLCARIRL